MTMFLKVLSLWCLYAWCTEATVLDPSLYLSPLPPLTDKGDSVPPSAMWSRSIDAKIIPNISESSQATGVVGKLATKPKRKLEPIKRAKLFWPSYFARSSQYSVDTGNVQVPLTFSLSGSYGKPAPGTLRTSIIGSSYGTVSEVGGTAVSALAGSGYGNFGTYPKLRIYAGENGPAWSGWGNGQWGHYGKG